MIKVPPFIFNPHCGGKFLLLQNEFTPSISKKKFFFKWTNFEKTKNLIDSKTAQPTLMAKIYVIQGTKEVMKKLKNQFRWLEGDTKIIVTFQQFFSKELLLEQPPFSCYIMLTFNFTVDIFFRKRSERYS